MKSTGLFGKNSGRVGGVVYSNYRGVQIVRAYQPKVSNPSTTKQVAQRAKFKLASQVAASLSAELKMSYISDVRKETSRNSFVKAMLKKITYSNGQATLPIEDVILTNSKENGFLSFSATSQSITGVLASSFGEFAKVRIILIGYNNGGEIVQLLSQEPELQKSGAVTSFSIQLQGVANSGYANVRALAYVYEPNTTEGATYEDYEVIDEEATLSDVLQVYSGRLRFSETFNTLVPQNV